MFIISIDLPIPVPVAPPLVPGLPVPGTLKSKINNINDI